MITYEKFTLDNGLKVIIHKDASTPIAAVNVLYDIGARDENPEKTGFAHLFEHLMFGGSVHIENYDEHVEKAGGENNAFTSNDLTNYYITLPKENLETALWLESDRMLQLAFTDKSLEVQRSVVIEEFKQNYLNQPYGDINMLLRDMAYKEHPYRWATIGKEVRHIEEATMEDVKNFFYSYYAPNNAILVVAGDVDIAETRQLIEKWFGGIERRDVPKRKLLAEPKQTEARRLEVERDVPINVLYKVFHMCSKTDEAYHTTDLLSDILSRGSSSRLYKSLVKEQKLFSDIDAYVGGDADPGLFTFSGKLMDGIGMEAAEAGIMSEIKKIQDELIGEVELTKVKNKVLSAIMFGEINVLNKAMSLAMAELAGDAENANREVERYEAVTAAGIQAVAKEIFREENSSTLYYKAKQ